jgi:predicted dehydrogenase
VIGCGNIGGLCDRAEDKRVISHAHAFTVHPEFDLVAACDLNPDTLRRFQDRWGADINLFRDSGRLLDTVQPDVVSVAVPTCNHADTLYEILQQRSPRLVICEKPLVENLEELDRLEDLLRTTPDKVLLVNYQRAWDPGFGVVESAIAEDSLGRPQSFYGTFSKGLYHNGCHLLELLDRFFEGIKSIRPIALNRVEDDFAGQFHVATGRCEGQLVSAESQNYWRTDLDILCENGLIRLADSGHRIEFHRPQDWSLYEGDRILRVDQTVPDTLDKSMYHTVQAGYRILSGERDSPTPARHLAFSRKLIQIRDGLQAGRSELQLEQDMEVVSP